jgi:hypothetical protein
MTAHLAHDSTERGYSTFLGQLGLWVCKARGGRGGTRRPATRREIQNGPVITARRKKTPVFFYLSLVYLVYLDYLVYLVL